MRRWLLCLAAIFALGSFAPAQTPPVTPPASERIIIKFRANASLLRQARAAVPRSLDAVARTTEDSMRGTELATVLSTSRIVTLRAVRPDATLEPLPAGIERLFIAELEAGANPVEVARSFSARQDVEYAEADARARLAGGQASLDQIGNSNRNDLVPSGSSFGLQWGLQNTAQPVNGIIGKAGADINATAAWNLTTGSSTITMAILDSGIVKSAPAFAGRLVDGWDFVNGRADASDDQGHGTAVASVAAATGNGNSVMAGVDWQCKIMPLKVIDAGGNAQYSNLILGITFAATHGAKIINMSEAGITSLQALQDAVNSAAAQGVIIVAAMGNDDADASVTPYYPAAYSNVISVGATNSSDRRAVPFHCPGVLGSNYGPSLDFVAPGDFLIALAYPGGTTATLYCGTSVATPMVSGTISLILSKNPSLNFDQIVSVLKEGARDQVGSSDEDTQGWDKYYGWGRIDAYRSILAAQGTNLFSHLAVGGGYTTLFTFINTGSAPVSATLLLTGSDGNPLDANLSDPSPSPELGPSGSHVDAAFKSITVPAGGTQFVTAAGSAGLKVGWALVQSASGLLSGVATFRLLDTAGALDAVAGVLSGKTVQYATIPVDDDSIKQRFTGYAVANPGTSSINIKIVIVDQNGNPVKTVRPKELNPLPAGNQAPKFLYLDWNDEPSTFRGSMVFIEDSGASFSVVALVQAKSAKSVLFTAIPVIPSKAPNIN